jgi:hypothetical protein
MRTNQSTPAVNIFKPNNNFFKQMLGNSKTSFKCSTTLREFSSKRIIPARIETNSFSATNLILSPKLKNMCQKPQLTAQHVDILFVRRPSPKFFLKMRLT